MNTMISFKNVLDAVETDEQTGKFNKTLNEKRNNLHRMQSHQNKASYEEVSPNFASSHMESLMEHSHESFGDSPLSKPKTDRSREDFVGFKRLGNNFSMTASPKKEGK